MRKFSDGICRENRKTHFIFNIFPHNSCLLSDNVEKYGTARQTRFYNIIRRVPLTSFVNKGIDTHLEYAHIFLSTTPMVTWTRLNVTFICTLPVLLNLALWMLRHREEIYWHWLGRRLITPHTFSGTDGRRKKSSIGCQLWEPIITTFNYYMFVCLLIHISAKLFGHHQVVYRFIYRKHGWWSVDCLMMALQFSETSTSKYAKV